MKTQRDRPTLHLLGVPYDESGPRAGSALGPAAIRLERLGEQLERLGLPVVDSGDLPIAHEASDPARLVGFQTALQTWRQLAYRTEGIVKNQEIPIVIGGDHSLAVGSIGGALRALGGDLAVLWIDAHADINTPDTSPSRNLHGMPLAGLTGLPCVEGPMADQWKDVLSVVGDGARLQRSRLAWLGLRDVDPGERDHIEASPGCFATTIQDLDRYGVTRVVDAFCKWLAKTRCKNLWISFDVDSLDPALAPGTGTIVRGGLTYREAHLIAELLAERLEASDFRLAGLDIVETNPTLDNGNQTAKAAVEWVCSLFGKKILGSRPDIAF